MKALSLLLLILAALVYVYNVSVSKLWTTVILVFIVAYYENWLGSSVPALNPNA